VKRWLLAGAAVLLVAAGAVGAYVLAKERASRDVRGSSTEEFVTTEEAPPPPPKKPNGVAWRTFGYDDRRQRVAPFDHRPPYRRRWVFRAQQLIEFPPAIGYGRLYFTNNTGVMFAVNTKTGRRAWKKPIGRCVASSPAVHGQRVFQSFLNRPPCNSNAKPGRLEGEVIAFDAGFGKIVWRTRIGPTESSPLVAYRRVYVGDWRGRVYALDQRTGRVRWTFRADGKIKGAVARLGTRVFVGTYSGRLYSLDARTGKLLWQAKSQDRLGGRGQFYSTPAVAYGRVYIGSTDGKVYSFGATSGKLRWSHGTGGYVYASPAVWKKRVYAGSYSGTMTALDAATGDVLWHFKANGPISGSPTVMRGLLYFATLKRRTYALDARTGRPVWIFPDGKYSPIVADRDRVYLVGYTRLYGLSQPPRPVFLTTERVAALVRAAGYERLVGFGVRRGRAVDPTPLQGRLPASVGLVAAGKAPRYAVAAQVLDEGQLPVSLRSIPVPTAATRRRFRACNVVVTVERETAAARRLLHSLRAACAAGK